MFFFNCSTCAQVGSLLECLNDSVTDVHVCCVGGVGSSFLMAFLNRRGLTTNLQTDADGLRHCPRYSAPRRGSNNPYRFQI